MNSRTVCKITLIFSSLLSFSACGRAARGAQTGFVMGTLCRIELPLESSQELYQRLFARLSEIDLVMSANRPDSELSRLNATAGPVTVSPDFLSVLERALYFAKASDGAFDPSVGPLVNLWGIGGEGQPRIPEPEAIEGALELLGWRDVELKDGEVYLKRTGMALDLGAIAKGFAADELAKILRDAGVRWGIIDLGGNIYVYGKKPASGGGWEWRVGIQNPLEERGAYLGYVKTEEAAIVTSGVYERYFLGEDGRRYHHILDTASGYPVENGLLSVTILMPASKAGPSTDADALSTACFALGFEKGAALAEASGACAIFVFEDKTIRLNAGAAKIFTLLDASFQLLEDRAR